MAGRGVARTARQQRQPALQAGVELIGRQDVHSGRRQLDGERQSVQPGTDVRDQRGGRRVDLEGRVMLAGPFDKEPARIGGQQLGGGGRGAGQRHRLHRQLALPRHPQRGAAGHERRDPRRRGQQRGHLRTGVQNLLEIVEHEQELLAAQEGDELFPALLTRPFAQAQRLDDGRQHHLRGMHIGERDKNHTVGNLVPGDGARGGHRQAGLADAAGAGQREQPHGGVRKQGEDGGNIGVAAHKRRQRLGEGRRGGARAGEGNDPRQGTGFRRAAGPARKAVEALAVDAVSGTLLRRRQIAVENGAANRPLGDPGGRRRPRGLTASGSRAARRPAAP